MAEAGTRARIVEAAASLFHRHGFQRTSLAEVLEESGVRGGSLYHFFKTKTDLLDAVLDRYPDLLEPVIMGPSFARAADPIERVFAVLGRYRELLVESRFALGCPIGNLALEMTEADDDVRQRLAANFSLWAATIERLLDDAADRLPPEVDRRRLAWFVLTVMEGAVLLARGHRDIAPFDDAVAQLREFIQRLLPCPPHGGAAHPAPTREGSS